MSFINKYPYTDFHELNLDWFLQEFNKLLAEWADLAADNAEFKQTMTERFGTLSDTVQEFTTFVTNYFDNLDVQEEINHKLDVMAADGTLDALLLPYFNAYKTEINGIVNTQNSRITVLEGRMDTFASLPDGSTAGDAELEDIRVGYNGVVYESAGDAVREQIIGVNKTVKSAEGRIDNLLLNDYGLGADYASKIGHSTSDTGAIISVDKNKISYQSSVSVTKFLYIPLLGLDPAKTYEFGVVADNTKIDTVSINLAWSESASGVVSTTLNYSNGKYSADVNNLVIGSAALIIAPKFSTSKLDIALSIIDKENGLVKPYIINADNLSSKLANKINVRVSKVLAGRAYNLSRILRTLSVGDIFAVESNNYSIIKVLNLVDGIKGVFVNGEDRAAPFYCVCDADNKVLKMGTNTTISPDYNYGYYVSLEGLSGAKYLYYQSITGTSVGVCYYDFGNDLIYEGDSIIGTVTGATSTGNNEKGFPIYKSDGTSAINISIASNDFVRSVGVWVKIVSNDDTAKLNNIKVELFNNTTSIVQYESVNPSIFRCGEWILLKFATIDQRFTKVVITPNLIDNSDPVTILIAGGVLLNHFTRPVYIVNFDQAWQATEDCGAYDLLLNNGIPFTITGKISSVDVTTKTKLLNAWKSGLIDIGSYGGEFEGKTVSVYEDYQTLISNINYCLEQKNNESGMPTSFGPGNHIANAKLVRALKESGYTCIKNGNSSWYQSVISEDKSIISLVTNPLSAMNTGSYCMFFWHGISSDPSAEANPAMYDSYDNFSTLINKIIHFKNEGGVLVMNMKQYAEYLSKCN